MAIRIRKVNETTVALCAAKTFPEKDDIYLDDSAHHALSTKFDVDYLEMGFLKVNLADENVKKVMLDQEKRKQPVFFKSLG